MAKVVTEKLTLKFNKRRKMKDRERERETRESWVVWML